MSGPPNSFDAVFYDIGGVIVNLPSIRQGYARYLQQFAADHDLDPEWAIDTWREQLGEHFQSADGTEYKTARKGYQKAFQALVDDDLAEDDWRPGFEAVTRETMEAESNVVETIERLDDAGIYLGIISDVDTDEAHRMLDQFGLDAAFDGITTSEAVGYKKPDSRMFETAIEAAPVDPSHSLMIGDRYEHDMVGGTDAGLRTIAYGGTAAEETAVSNRDGRRIYSDDAVDFLIEDHRETLDIVGIAE